MIVWLDDVRPMPHGYTIHVKSAVKAIELLKTNQVTQISLDHDLGDYQETGYDVAKWIEEHAADGSLKPLRCKVHSQNPVGAQNIKVALRNAYRSWGK